MRSVSALLLLASASCSFPEYVTHEPEPVESCQDGLLSAGEVAIDCGPVCSGTCAMGQSCTFPSECQSGNCQQGVCRAMATCSDGARNQSETDIDCGGVDGCAPCATDHRCESDYDCNLAKCNAGFCKAQGCSDGLQNQDESDVDCGGTHCQPCHTKQHCNSNSDCLDSECSQGLCQAQGCEDGVPNGDETDTDCGGSCIPCGDYSACVMASDCASLSCGPEAHVCQPASCDDGILNGGEAAPDCGSSCANGKRCGLTVACTLDADCESGKCDSARCVPAVATGTPLSTAGWIASASATFSMSVPPKAIDGNVNSMWESGTGQVPGMWFQVDMLQPRPFFALELQCTSNGDYPRSLRMLLSEDGQTYTAATGAVTGEKNVRFDFAAAKIARYIKLEIQQDTGGLWWRIDELRVMQ
jgi:hypothetical protein